RGQETRAEQGTAYLRARLGLITRENSPPQLLIPHSQPRRTGLDCGGGPIGRLALALLVRRLPRPLLPRQPPGVELEDQIAQGIELVVVFLRRIARAFLVLVKLRLR